MATATVTSKGQITIPQQIRKVLRVEPGDRVDFVVAEAGQVLVRASTADIAELKGLLRRAKRRPVSIEEMDAAILAQHRKRR